MNLRVKFIKDNIGLVNKNKHTLSYADAQFLLYMTGRMANSQLEDLSHEEYNRLHALAERFNPKKTG